MVDFPADTSPKIATFISWGVVVVAFMVRPVVLESLVRGASLPKCTANPPTIPEGDKMFLLTYKHGECSAGRAKLVLNLDGVFHSVNVL